jgi:DTW domain-containing protein YfiP
MQRPHCTRCRRAQRTCICHWITPIEHPVEVLILQHPIEVYEAKGSARLLHLSLPRSRMVTGEMFDERQLQAWLTAPFPDDAPQVVRLASPPSDALRHPVLLYPTTQLDATLATPPVLTPEQLRTPSLLRLVVLDGTWRKSRKVLHLNPLLRQLPRLALHDIVSSRYLIRKAQQSHQLSTLEATCAALAQLEGSAARVAPLLAAFDGFVAQQLQQRHSQDKFSYK